MIAEYQPGCGLNLYRIVKQKIGRYLSILTIVILLTTPNNVYSANSITHSVSDFNSGTFDDGSEQDINDRVSLKKGETTYDDLSAIPEVGDDYVDPAFFGADYENGKIKLKKSYHHSLAQSPGLVDTMTSAVFFDGDYMYVSNQTSDSYGVTIIDTKGTDDPGDDELIRRLGEYSAPLKIPDNVVQFIFKEGQVIYVCSEGGLTLINTQGTTSPLDDTLITTYSGVSTPAISSPDVNFGLVENNIAYLGTNNGVSILNLGNPLITGDDAFIKRYAIGTTPALSGSNIYNIQKVGNLLIVTTSNGGTSILNIGDPLNATDDSLVKTYDDVSTPALLSKYDYYSLYDNGFLFVGTSSGMTLLNVGDLANAGDDSLVKNYTTTSSPVLSGGSIRHILLAGTKVYISNASSGLFVFDLHDFTNPSDDEQIIKYSTTSDPPIIQNSANYTIIHNGLIYVCTWARGLDVINPNGYFSEGLVQSNTKRIPSNQKIISSINKAAGQNISIRTRTGNSDSTTSTNFTDGVTSEYSDDYGWTGSSFGTVEEVGGKLRLSNPTPRNTWNNLNQYVDFWIDMKNAPEQFMAGSSIRARIKINSDTVVTANSNYMFDELWDLNESIPFALAKNTWKDVTFNPLSSFRYVGFQIVWGINSWSSGDSLEIEFVQVDEVVLAHTFDFNEGNTDYYGDKYNWGNIFQTAQEVGGNLILSDPNEELYYGESAVTFWFDSGMPEDYFPKGSVVKIRYRQNSSTAQPTDWSYDLFSDEWVAWDETYLESGITNNQWYETTNVFWADGFSDVGFSPGWVTGTWSPGDTLEIDYVEIYTPYSWGTWSDWCDLETCNIADTVGKELFQYQVKFETTDPSTTPELNYVQLGDSNYYASGAFTSPVVDAGEAVDWTDLDTTSNTPPSTSITYRTRSGNTATPDETWSDWQAVNSPIASPDSRYLQYEAVLTTTDSTVTPTISSVLVSYNELSSPPVDPGDGDTDPPVDPGDSDTDTNSPSTDGTGDAGGSGSTPKIVTGTLPNDRDGDGTPDGEDDYDNSNTQPTITGSGNGSAGTGEGLITQNPISDKDKDEDGVVLSLATYALAFSLLAYMLVAFRKIFPKLSDYWQFLGALFTVKGKKKQWGTVFDSISVKPISGATVSIFETHFNQLVETKITDTKGRFVINAKEGEYYILVSKEGYRFPSTFNSSYTGKKFTISQEESLILLDIPLDPANRSSLKRAFSIGFSLKGLNTFIGKIYYPTLLAGTIFSVYSVIKLQNTLSYLVLTLYILLWIYEAITIFYERTYGIVYDPKERKPIDNATVRVFSAQTQKLLETKVTNLKGRYNLLLTPGQYLVQVTGENFQPMTKEVKLSRDSYLTENFYVRN